MVLVTPPDMRGPVIAPVENLGAFVAGEGPGRNMQGSDVTVEVAFVGERLVVRAAGPAAPEIRWLRATGTWESAWTAG